jgi:hypothetical protein
MPSVIPTVAPRAGPGPCPSVFLNLLPTVVVAARRHFRHLACAERREDRICETVALAWAWYCRLAERGRDPTPYSFTLSRLAAQAVASGRRLCGQERANDILSFACRRNHGFAVLALPHGPPSIGAELTDALTDNTQSAIPVQVQFRCDFPAWVRRLPARKQRILKQLALGHRTSDIATAFGVSSARIAQLRGELRRNYFAFLADRPGH